jgi:hypothetical protein
MHLSVHRIQNSLGKLLVGQVGDIVGWTQLCVLYLSPRRTSE